jgi:uncharacterized protein (TIGR02996 family)
MDTEQTLLAALHEDPQDGACWLALADWLEESGQSDRAALLRLRSELPAMPRRKQKLGERRLRELLEEGVRPPLPILSAAGLELMLIPAGRFWMGSLEGEPGRHRDEDPRHRVGISRAFYLGVYPVTQGQYQRVMGNNPSHFAASGEGSALVRELDTSRLPVESVSWNDAQDFCKRLSRLASEQAAGRLYRLPTEAEWEYACRACTTSLFCFGDDLTSDRANIDGNLPEGDLPRGPFLQRTSPVGSYPPNAFGLYDMHGNVWEWCADWFDDAWYPVSPQVDPRGPEEGTRRALRGGSWYYGARICRSAYRYRYEPDARHNDFGFRVAMTPPA